MNPERRNVLLATAAGAATIAGAGWGWWSGREKGADQAAAQALWALDFQTPAIAASCNELKIPGGLIPLPKNDSPRRRYELAANWTYARLMENAISQTASFNIDLP